MTPSRCVILGKLCSFNFIAWVPAIMMFGLDVFLLPPDLVFFPTDYKWVEYSNDSVGYAILVYRKDI